MKTFTINYLYFLRWVLYSDMSQHIWVKTFSKKCLHLSTLAFAVGDGEQLRENMMTLQQLERESERERERERERDWDEEGGWRLSYRNCEMGSLRSVQQQQSIAFWEAFFSWTRHLLSYKNSYWQVSRTVVERMKSKLLFRMPFFPIAAVVLKFIPVCSS
jgi:hypothetical protein